MEAESLLSNQYNSAVSALFFRPVYIVVLLSSARNWARWENQEALV